MTDKMKFETPNLTAENSEKLAAKISELFPGVVTEGKVNFDLLRSMLGDDVYGDEAYEFTWVGKRAAIAEAGRPIRKTLRPCVEESKDWDTTENLYIEGDNLDVLKLLQESYLGKVKMIYIDPPYNTGSDFIYRDDFKQSREEYEEETGEYDEDGDRLFRNTETNGRFHSDWCSMIYPRLVLARNLLSHDGIVFISIDDNEVAQLRKICDEVFGSDNVETMVWKKIGDGDAGAGRMKTVNRFRYEHENIIVAYKNVNNAFFHRLMEIPDFVNEYGNPDNDPRGAYKAGNMSKTEEKSIPTGKNYYTVTSPSGKTFSRQWHFDESEFRRLDNDNRIYWGKNGDAVPAIKIFVNEPRQIVPNSLLENLGSATSASKDLRKLLQVDENVFDNPKPVALIQRFLYLTTTPADIILDFFSGSATTAHAVMQLNAEDGGKRKFVMVQLPEMCAEGTEAAKAGYKNICEIGKERIRRAGDEIKAEAGLTAQNLDIGFRVLKLDDTNMNDVYYAAGDYTQDLILQMESNIKPDRTDMDLLYGCLLEWGLPLSMPHTHEKIDGFTVHTYNDGDLIACFEERIREKVIREIASRKPLRAVFRDSSFSSSPEKINVFEIFKLLAPNTNVRVI